MYTLDDLQQLRQIQSTKEEQAIQDREDYLRGKRCYPSAPDESLSERARECYMMGFNYSMWENGHV